MKISGILLVILGVILGVVAMAMDISYNGYNNLGLMNDRSNLTIGAGVAFISGILLIGFSSFGFINSIDDKKCPHCAEMIKREATICRFCQKEQPIQSEILVTASTDLKREIVELNDNGHSYWIISADFNDTNKPIPETYSEFQKWSPKLVKLIADS